jgi:hypothetical protein
MAIEERRRMDRVMIVSHRHKFIFLKTRKTAGTALEIGLSQYCGPDDIITPIAADDEELRRSLGFAGPRNYEGTRRWFRKDRPLKNHDDAATIRRRVGEDVWRDYFKFTIERNPFDRAISLYWFQTQLDTRRPAIGAFLKSCEPWRLSNWPLYSLDGQVAVDHVIRFERLDAEVPAIAARLGIGPIEMVRVKAAFRLDRRPYREVLDVEARQLIERHCAREIAEFSYAW